jgi:hypothetical protein
MSTSKLIALAATLALAVPALAQHNEHGHAGGTPPPPASHFPSGPPRGPMPNRPVGAPPPAPHPGGGVVVPPPPPAHAVAPRPPVVREPIPREQRPHVDKDTH